MKDKIVDKVLIVSFYFALIVQIKHLVDFVLALLDGNIIAGWGTTVSLLMVLCCLVVKYTKSFKQFIVSLIFSVIIYAVFIFGFAWLLH